MEGEVILKRAGEAQEGETQGQDIVKGRSASQEKIPREEVSGQEVTDGSDGGKEVEPCIQASS